MFYFLPTEIGLTKVGKDRSMSTPLIQRPVDPKDYPTFSSFEAYLEPRIHPKILNPQLERIVVKGCYKRRGKPVQVSENEKSDKTFNWHRPTVNILNETTIELLCFPGQDYVQHQALMTATYLGLRHMTTPVVEYVPLTETSMDIFENSNLRLMGPVHTAVIGYADRILPEKLQNDWQTGTDEPDQIFAWKTYRQANGDLVAFIGCMVSLWGDIFENVVLALKSLNNVTCILYIGKAGSLRPLDVPNRVLVTGDSSHIDGDLISWDNPLRTAINEMQSKNVVWGTHVTVSSPLVESKPWIRKWKDKAQLVDCEVGHIARMCKKMHMQFGYLHVISDNVARYYPQNLTTDRDPDTINDRKIAFKEIWRILQHYFQIEDTTDTLD